MSKYRKSWTQALQEVFNESAGLQLKMAFDDAGIKIKGVKGGKLVVDKKDKKKVEKIIAKQMKKPSDAKRILGSQIVLKKLKLMKVNINLLMIREKRLLHTIQLVKLERRWIILNEVVNTRT